MFPLFAKVGEPAFTLPVPDPRLTFAFSCVALCIGLGLTAWAWNIAAREDPWGSAEFECLNES